MVRDWLGNEFYGWIKSNPIEFNHAERDANCWAENVEVTLEWEGIPIPPHPSIILTVPADMNVSAGDNEIGNMISFVYGFSETITLNISVDGSGTVTPNTAPPGIISVIGSGTSSVTINGSVAAVNGLLAGSITINLPMSAATYTITVTVSAATPGSTIKTFQMVT